MAVKSAYNILDRFIVRPHPNSPDMKNIAMLVATLLAAVIPAALASADCWNYDCNQSGFLTKDACTCSYDGENGNDGICNGGGNDPGNCHIP
ncbi:hypothetical protein BST61_g378 [Cercospora zeina]